MLPRLAANEIALREAYALVTKAVRSGTQITPAAEWFIDNYHLVEEQIRTARRHLPRGYSRELPRLGNALVAGTPRVYDLTLEFISHSHGRLDVAGLQAFIASYQEQCSLTLGELWAIPIMLRLALIENLRRIVAGVVAGRRDRERAGHWVEQMLDVASRDPAQVVLVLAEMVRADPPLTVPFVAELMSRLSGRGAALLFPISWLEHRMAERGQTVEGVFHLVSQDQAADQVAIGNTFGSLRLLGATDWRNFVEALSSVERALRSDPAGIYPSMDFSTRDRYRLAAEELARCSPLSQEAVAQAAIDLAGAAAAEGDERRAHVGYFLIGDGRERLERRVVMRRDLRLAARRVLRRFRLELYVGAIVLGTAALTALLSLSVLHPGLERWQLTGLLLVGALASSQLAVGIVHWALTLLVQPHSLPRLDFSAGIPALHQTVVAVPTLLTDTAEIERLLESLEVRFLANRDPQLSFALLSDFRDAPSETLDTDAALLERAEDGIRSLNARYTTLGAPPPFFLFHRARQWNPTEGVWMGWERKRGKLENFNAALRGSLGHFSRVVGDAERLRGVKYVIALDSDTQLPRDAARQLASTLAHPLNRPRYDPEHGRVSEGYAILQPRVDITLASSSASHFAGLFSGEPGIDPYTRAVSDVYQDVFDEGSFTGKGIYDVDAVRLALAGRLPLNRILSHDLLEGAYARSGLVSDITLFEDHPASYAADVSRRYRWMRGDWQITPWLTQRVPHAAGRMEANRLSRLSRWKVLDNLRRSLFPIASLLLLIGGWLAGSAVAATLAVLAILVLPAILAAGADLLRRPSETPFLRHVRDVAHTLGRQLLRDAFALACLPYDAFVSCSAVVRTAGRVLVTGRHLLEWRTASDAQRSALTGLAGTYRVMLAAPLIALAAGITVALRAPQELAGSAPVVLMWLSCPAIAWWLSQPLRAAPLVLRADDKAFLRGVARRTWRFFETFVTEADNYLPPDNVQEDPPRGVAHRTSPTNIGLALTANLAAYDFGYSSAGELIESTTRTLHTLDRLARYRGHLYNWYDTTTLQPLAPLYISTVDSGNLIGHLITLAMGLGELAEQPIFRAQSFAGLRDTLAVLEELAPAPQANLSESLARLRLLLEAPPLALSAVHGRLEALESGSRELSVAARAHSGKCAEWALAFARQCQKAREELLHLAPWVLLLPDPKLTSDAPDPALTALLLRLDGTLTLNAAARLSQALPSEFEDAPARSSTPAEDVQAQLSAAVQLGSERASDRLGALRALALRTLELCNVDYEFLYDRARHLLAIGYNVADHRLDASFYDLLASEARLASFVAIAQGKLPQDNWFCLGRLLTTTGGRPALLSWSGSMFEYLMPLLIMPTYARTILGDTCRGVVERQIEYGHERGVPWGVSESGYNKTDAQLNYQYRAFGVPGLGFKRGLADDLVIAPYASALALMVSPEAATANLRRLAGDGLLDGHGFYEAVDYTPSRLPRGAEWVIVRSYMAHHQGMTFLSLAHALLERPMQERFERYPAFRAADLLLQERVPKVPSIYPHPAEVSAASGALPDSQSSVRVYTTPNTPTPEVHLLSNGNYHVAISNSGAGYSRWKNLAVTRWHEDPTRDCWGSFCYLRDVSTSAFWSVAHQPSLAWAESYEAIFSQGRAEFRRLDQGIETHVEISISPEDDVELRRVSLTNRGRSVRSIELTTFAEVVLAPQAADAAHPAFSNLFVQTELAPSGNAILCTRRPRSAAEHPPWMLHLMSAPDAVTGRMSFETSRAEFIGRGRSARTPQALQRDVLTNSQGSVLDPVVSIRNRLVIQPNETLSVHIVTGVAATRDAALALIEKYSDPHSADRVFELSWTHSQVVLRQLDLPDADAQLYERLAGQVIYANPNSRAPLSVIARNKSGQSALWAYGISGDLPIVLLRIADLQRVGLVRQLVKAHTYWRLKGLVVDLIIWNEDSSGYRQVLQEEILGVIGPGDASLLDRPGGIFVRRADQLSEEDRVLMQTVARLIVSDSEGPLSEQVNRRLHVEVPAWLFARQRDLPAREAKRVLSSPPVAHERPDLVSFNGLGGFTHDGREYVITTTAESRTPKPWVNVLANPWFGTLVSESGGGYTWCENSRMYRLTPWHNDPVGDESGEALYIRDDETGLYWSPTPLPAGGTGRYTTRHGFGYSVFEHDEAGLSSELSIFVAMDAPLKFCVLELRNHSGRARRLSLTACFDLVLGDQRSANAPFVVSELDLQTNALFARNSYNAEFGSRVAFLDSSEGPRSVSGDRLEMIGRNQNSAQPAFLRRAQLSGRVGASLDPCLAMQTPIELASGEQRQVVFIFGSGRDLADARALVQRFRGTGAARAALEGVWSYWSRTLGVVNVQTPNVSLNFLANGWLLYQVLASRMFGRTGFYQSGGAFGFRDQLQDAMSLVHAEPGLLREQLLRSASRQFREGDVQHWWHPRLGRGVRTRISDDYLWLPQAVCRYVATHGDTGVLDEIAPFLEGRLVKPEEDSYYDLPARSEESATLYQHCVRAIEHGLRFGEHGLPLMGSGDWNDGMNLVGDAGRGESVWLGFFLYDTLCRFAELARRKGDEPFAERCLSQATSLQANLEAHGWDGAWYRRAYFDSGEPLGSASNSECQIDSLPQSWAVLSGAADEARASAALEAVDRRLVRRDLALIQLFDPPFSSSPLEPGYVKGYVPGVRENGGQYTHAAVWAVMAFAAAGDVERAWELFELINPIRHGASAEAIATYQVEPYVVAADVYTNLQHAGRGGWTWYTGSAGWLYRLLVESFLGVRLEVDRLRIEPRVPASWPAFDVHYRHRSALYHIHVDNLGASRGDRSVTRVCCDLLEQPDRTIPLHDDGREHHAHIELGGPDAAVAAQ